MSKCETDECRNDSVNGDEDELSDSSIVAAENREETEPETCVDQDADNASIKMNGKAEYDTVTQDECIESEVDSSSLSRDANAKENGETNSTAAGSTKSSQSSASNKMTFKFWTSWKSSSSSGNYEALATPPPRPKARKPQLTKAVAVSKVDSAGNEVLPPLPPKRIRKSLPFNRSLPSIPRKESKLTKLQRLFSLRKKKSKENEVREDAKNCEDEKQILSRKSTSENQLSSSCEDELSLTEAEHYALYTSVAPRASVSEFDDNSCYYSPVEGGELRKLEIDL